MRVISHVLRCGGVLSALLLVKLPVLGGTLQAQSVAPASGQRSTAGSLMGLACGGQSIVSLAPREGALRNYVGFLGQTVLQNSLDHDGDGVCDELDDDNDNDGLSDAREILGDDTTLAIATDPNDADTDHDGESDGAEWVADTDPTDAASALIIKSIVHSAGGTKVDWIGGHASRQYLMRRADLKAGAWSVVLTNEPPTATVASMMDPSATNAAAFYQIRAERP